MRSAARFVFVLLLAAPVFADDTVAIDTAQFTPGTLFCTDEEAAGIRARVDNYDWAGAIRDQLRRRAENLMTTPFAVSKLPGGFSGNYYCPRDNTHLEADPEGGHRCRVCGTRYKGRQYDNAHVAWQHDYWLGGVETLGWAYTVSGDERYSERAREIMLAYADWGIEDQAARIARKDPETRTRLLPQSLDEARLLCRLAVGYDRVYRAAAFAPADHEHIARGLIRPILDHIVAADHKLSNWQSWHNAAMTCAGLLLGDRAVIDAAINGPYGFLDQMREGVVASGMWREAAPVYHFFALRAHIYLLEGMYRAGVDFYRMPVVAGLFNAPARWPYPDGTLPPLNDSERMPLRDYRDLYEVGYRRCKYAHFEQLLPPRDSPWALVWGARSLPVNFERQKFILKSSNEVSEGLAILRDPARGIAAYFDYNNSGAGHIQPARLGLVLFAQGDERFIDPGRVSYANPLHKGWYAQTIAHNAPMDGARSQYTDVVRLLNYYADDGFAIVRAMMRVEASKTNMRRTLLLSGGCLFDLVEFSSETERSFDLPLHVNGKTILEQTLEPAEPLGTRYGYELIEDCRRFPEPPEALRFETGEGQSMRIQFLKGADETFLANGIGRIPDERIPMILRRTTAMRTAMASVTEWLPAETQWEEPRYWTGNGHHVAMAGLTLDAGVEVFVTRQGKRYRIGMDEAIHVDADGVAVPLDPLEQVQESLRRRNERQLPAQLRSR